MNQRVLGSLSVEQETTIREMFQNHPKRRLREKSADDNTLHQRTLC